MVAELEHLISERTKWRKNLRCWEEKENLKRPSLLRGRKKTFVTERKKKNHTHSSNNHTHTHTGASCSDTPAPTLVLVAELELELLKILLYNFLTNKGKKLQYWEEKNLQKPLRFLNQMKNNLMLGMHFSLWCRDSSPIQLIEPKQSKIVPFDWKKN